MRLLLAYVLDPETSCGKVVSVETVVTDEPRNAQEGTWVLGGGIETPCKYDGYAEKTLKCEIRKMLRKAWT